MGRRITIEECRLVAAERGFELVSDAYDGQRAKLRWRCPKGHEWETILDVVKRGFGCPTCSGCAKHDLAFLQRVAQTHGGECLSEAYTNMQGRYRWRCVLGHEWTARACSVHTNRTWCKTCAPKKISEKLRGKLRTSLAACDAAARARGGECLATEYSGVLAYYWWRCKAGHEWQATAANVVNMGTWCRKCSQNGPSRGQLDLYEFVHDLAPDAVLDHVEPASGLEADVFAPSRMLAIEYNGLFWHSAASPTYRNNRERDKARAMRAAGYDYFMIYEDEWRDKRQLVESMVRWRLGCFQGTKLNARDLEVRRLERNAEFAPFFAEHHLDGHARANYAVGLFRDGVLVMCASVRTNHRGETEVARMATHQGYSVRGGAQKLLAALPRPLVSYSNNRLSSGDVYAKAGFVEVTQTQAPSYYYTDTQRRWWRFRCRRVNDPAVLARFPGIAHTEAAQAAAGVFSERLRGDRKPLWRIEDCGHRKWLLL